jgi:peroxiredoxin Q/BCP
MRGLLLLLLMLPALALGVGDPAPTFKLAASDGKTYALEQFQGKSWVVLNFFPKPFTPGCTTQCNALRDDSAKLSQYQAVILAVNTSTLALNEEFAAKKGYQFPLLADPDWSVTRAYDVVLPGGFAARRNFVIDPHGVIRAAFDVSPDKALQQVVESLDALGVPKT